MGNVKEEKTKAKERKSKTLLNGGVKSNSKKWLLLKQAQYTYLEGYEVFLCFVLAFKICMETSADHNNYKKYTSRSFREMNAGD